MYLYKLLNKIKAVSESPSLPADVRKQTTLSADTAVLNIHARLCNSKPVKEAVPAILADVQGALGIKIDAPKDRKKQQAKAVPVGAASSPQANGSAAKPSTQATEVTLRGSSDDDDDEGLSGSEDSDAAFATFEGRLASSGEDEEEGSDVEAIERQLEAEGIARKASGASRPTYNHAADLNLSSDDDGNSASPPPEPRKAATLKQSSFVPTLSMAGYISGSGSDIDDIDEAPKKNRRGQRARQQIWEKKFGQKAKHLQHSDKVQAKDWDPKRGATHTGDRRGKGKRFDRGGGPRRSEANDEALGKRPDGGDNVKHRDDGGSIHPSWEAAKKAKEKKAAPVPFQGRKITFD